MAINRLKITQPEGQDPKIVAFTDDILLNGLTGNGLITVSGNGKEKTVTTDTTKLTLQDGNVKVVTPLILDAKGTPPSTPTNALYAVNDGTESKLYWNGKLVDAHAEGEGYVLESTFTTHVINSGDAKHVTATQLGQLAATDGKALATQEWASAAFADKGEFNTLSGNVGTLEGKVTAIEESYIKDIQDSSANEQVSVHFGKSLTPNTLTTSVTVTTATQDSETKTLSGNGLVTGSQAQDAINAGVSEYNTDVIGVWSTISDKTVKTAIEENKAKIAALEGNHFIVVDTLPAVGQPNCIYLVPKQGGEAGNIKEEWIYVNNAWEKIGDTAVDLSEYAKTTDVQSMISNAVDAEEQRAETVEANLNTAVTAAQTDVDNLETLVGTLPTGATATTVVGYVDEKAGATADALRDTADTASATSTDTHVTVNLTGTVGNHGLTVTTSDIASASALSTLTGRVTTAEGEIDNVETKLAGITGTVKAYVDAETTRATTAEGELDTRLDTAEGKITTIEGKLVGLPTDKTIEQAIEDAVSEEETRATAAEDALDVRATALEAKVGTATLNTTAKDLSGAVNELKSAVDTDTTAIGTLNNLKTEAKGNLVAAINEVDAHADAAQAAADTAQATAEDRLASITGGNGQGVSVQFSTSDTKAVTTTITVTESTLDADSKFASDDTDVATGAKVQAAIDAAEARAKAAQTYTADGTTLQLSGNKFSAKTAAVAENGAALTTGGQVYTAIDTAKTNITGQIGTLSSLSTEAKNNLVAAINEVDSHADDAQSTANTALSTANNAVQTVTSGDTTNIKAERSGSTVTITPDGNLASLLSHLSIVQEQ